MLKKNRLIKIKIFLKKKLKKKHTTENTHHIKQLENFLSQNPLMLQVTLKKKNLLRAYWNFFNSSILQVCIQVHLYQTRLQFPQLILLKYLLKSLIRQYLRIRPQ